MNFVTLSYFFDKEKAYMRQRQENDQENPTKNASTSVVGSGAGITAIPNGSRSPETSAALTLRNDV